MKYFSISIFFILLSCQNLSFKEKKIHLNVSTNTSKSSQLKKAYDYFFKEEEENQGDFLYLFKSSTTLEGFCAWIEEIRKSFFLPILGEELKKKIKTTPSYSDFLKETIMRDNDTKSPGEPDRKRQYEEDYMIPFLTSPRSFLTIPSPLPTSETYIESDSFHPEAARREIEAPLLNTLIGRVNNIEKERSKHTIALKRSDLKTLCSSLKETHDLFFEPKNRRILSIPPNRFYDDLFKSKKRTLLDLNQLNDRFTRGVVLINPFGFIRNSTVQNRKLIERFMRLNEILKKISSLEEHLSSLSGPYLSLEELSNEMELVKSLSELLRKEINPLSNDWQEGSFLEGLDIEIGYESLFEHNISLVEKDSKFNAREEDLRKHALERLFRVVFNLYPIFIQILAGNQVEILSNYYKGFQENYLCLSMDNFLISSKNKDSFRNALFFSINILKNLAEALVILFPSTKENEFYKSFLGDATSILSSLAQFNSRTNSITPARFLKELNKFELEGMLYSSSIESLFNGFFNFQHQISQTSFKQVSQNHFKEEKEKLKKLLLDALGYLEPLGRESHTSPIK